MRWPVLCAMLCLCVTRNVHAQAVPLTAASPRLETVGQTDYLVTGGALALAGAFEIATEPPARGSWGSAGFIDDDVRDLLRLHAADGRKLAARISDAGFYALVLWPALADPAVVAMGGDPSLAWRLFIVHLESLAVAGALTRPAQRVGQRDRPLYEPCLDDPDYHEDCDSPAESLASGHVAIAFAGASALCGSHLVLHTYGGGAADYLTCGGALTLATATAVLRISSDMHWTTDILIGAAIGGAAGTLLPWLLHYGRISHNETTFSLTPFADANGAGIGIAGRM